MEIKKSKSETRGGPNDQEQQRPNNEQNYETPGAGETPGGEEEKKGQIEEEGKTDKGNRGLSIRDDNLINPCMIDGFDGMEWNSKVARFITYCVDGGLMQSNFTISKLILMMKQCQDNDEKIIQNEIAYMLHVRRIGKEYQRDPTTSLDKVFRDLMTNFSLYEMNYKVLVTLIETGFCQQIMNFTDKSEYPKFLIKVYKESDRCYIKEAICRMIIKYFDRKKGEKQAAGSSGPGGGQADDSAKIEFINMVEPLVQVVSRSKENGVAMHKLTALSIMAILNMCNYSEDIKDIFLQKNGFQIIMDLLDSKDYDILENCLKLIINLIAKKQGDTNQIGRTLAEEKGNALLRKLINLVKEDTGIRFCHFPKQVYYQAIQLLRAFIQHSSATKQLIMNDRSTKKNIIEKIIWMINPDNIYLIDSDIENAILSLLTQVVKEEIENKRIIGEMFIKDAGVRMQAIMEYSSFTMKQQRYLETNQISKLRELMQNKCKYNQHIEFNEQTEMKFLKLINILVKNSEENFN